MTDQAQSQDSWQTTILVWAMIGVVVWFFSGARDNLPKRELQERSSVSVPSAGSLRTSSHGREPDFAVRPLVHTDTPVLVPLRSKVSSVAHVPQPRLVTPRESAPPRQRRMRTIGKIPTVNTGGKVPVRGYYRKDGTYVRPHTRRHPAR